MLLVKFYVTTFSLPQKVMLNYKQNSAFIFLFSLSHIVKHIQHQTRLIAITRVLLVISDKLMDQPADGPSNGPTNQQSSLQSHMHAIEK